MKSRLYIAALAALLLAPTASFAQETTQPAPRFTAEQKAAKKAEWQQKWQAMTPEEQAAKKAQVRERYNNMSPEQKAKLHDGIKARRQMRTQGFNQ